MNTKHSTFALAYVALAALSMTAMGCGMYSTADEGNGSSSINGNGNGNGNGIDVTGTSTINAGDGLLVVNFDPEGGLLRDVGLLDMDLTGVSQINIGGVDVVNGECILSPALANLLNSQTLANIESAHPNLDIVLSIGGKATFAGLTVQVSTDILRDALATSCIPLMEKHGLDGIDINFEQLPQGDAMCGCSKNNGDALLGLVQVVRTRLNEREKDHGAPYLLSLQISSQPSVVATLNLAALHPHVNHLDIKAFDLNGAWEKVTNLAAPLHACSDDPSGDKESRSVAALIDSYLAAGVPSKKLVLGVAFDGYGWTGVPPTNNGLYQSSLGLMAGLQVAGLVDYAQIMATIGLQTFWSHEAKAPWAYAAGGLMFTFENEQSLKAKIDYASKVNLGGIMVRQAGCDGKGQPLLNAVADRLRP